MKKQFDFITIGGTTEDITFYTKDAVMIDNKQDVLQQKLMAFEYGAKLKIDKAYSSFGGGASNAAICLSRLGLKVATLVSIGEDNRGKDIIKNFRDHKINTSLIQKQKNKETGFTFFIVGGDKEHVGFSNRAANQILKIDGKAKNLLIKAEWLYVTSLSGAWQQVLSSVFSVPKIKIAWNPGHIQLKAGLKNIGKYLAKAEVVTVNKDEAIELVISDPKYRNKNNSFLNNSKNLLKILQERGVKIIVITAGPKGADVYDGQKFYHQNIFKEKVRRDTTGVGDAFGSTFTAGLQITNGDIQKAMYMGARNTASVIGEPGAQNGLLSRSQIFRK